MGSIKKIDKRYVWGILLLLSTASAWKFFHCEADPWVRNERRLYHGIPARLALVVPSNHNGSVAKIFDMAWAEFDRLGTVMNAFSPTSEVGRWNQHASLSRSVHLSPDFERLLITSKFIHAQTRGAFDPTLWPIKMLWHEAFLRQRAPSDAEKRFARRHTGLNHITIASHDLRADIDGISFDFGGIAKGDAVDQVANRLRECGIRIGLVQLGGEIQTWGDSGREWSLGIQHPIDLSRMWGRMMSTRPLRVSTSGNYRQAIRIGNRDYYHVFDPRTADPVSEHILSVTLVASRPTVSNAMLDALTKSILVLGVEKGLETIRPFDIDWVILLQQDHRIRAVVGPHLVQHGIRVIEEPSS